MMLYMHNIVHIYSHALKGACKGALNCMYMGMQYSTATIPEVLGDNLTTNSY